MTPEPALREILAHWGISSVRELKDIWDDKVFRVETDTGELLTLKNRGLIREAFRAATVEFQSKVMSHLEDSGVNVPSLLSMTNGSLWLEYAGEAWTLAKFLRGGVGPKAIDVMPELYRNIGREIARMHQALAAYPAEGLEEVTWHEDLPLGIPRWASKLKTELSPDLAAEFAPLVDRLIPEMLPLVEGLPEQLIHRDCHFGNILVDGPKVLGFIDCDHFCIGPRIFDLAYLAANQMKAHLEDAAAISHLTSLLEDLLKGYHEVCPLKNTELIAFPHVMMSVPLLFAWWFLTIGKLEWIPRDLQALGWMSVNKEVLASACARVT